ncbi:hypothetical protein [Polyangium sorediatum]|uniref:Uncharacterized protein n=1 Tax=Polyangium sorediatum TaxID=889274 RepID=A0ABT6NYI2_9BACT|nr:hypothetical protein [Polyangium sorediatum]MDI1433353.1 hypothetical protein [Polyangium sorediatum]
MSDEWEQRETTLPVTARNLIDWEQALSVLGMERWWPFFEAMGLPPALTLAPEPTARLSRRYVEERAAAEKGSGAPPSERRLFEERERLERYFQDVGAELDTASAAALRVWCVLHVVDEHASNALTTWDHLFGRLCGTTTNEGLTVPPDLPAALLERICALVQAGVDPKAGRELRRRVQAAAEPSATAWEAWLEARAAYGAGDGERIGVVDASADLVKVILSQAATRRVLQGWERNLAPAEQEALMSWARRQAERIGLPDPAWP